MVSGLDKLLAASKHNRKNSPYHYWLNPFVRGPLDELLMRAQRRQLASTGSSMLNAVLQESRHQREVADGSLGRLISSFHAPVTGRYQKTPHEKVEP